MASFDSSAFDVAAFSELAFFLSGDAPAPSPAPAPAGGHYWPTKPSKRKPSKADEERDEDRKRLRELINQAASGRPSDVREAASAIAAAPVEVVAAVESSKLHDYLELAREAHMKRQRIAALERQIEEAIAHRAEAERIERIRRDDEELMELLGASGLLQ